MFIKNWLKSPIFYGIGYLILYVVIGLILYKLDYMYLQGFRVFSILLIATLLIAGLVLYIKNKEGSALDQVFMLIILVIVTVIFLVVEALLPRERIVTVGNEKQVEVTSNTFLKENVNYYQYVNIFVRGNKIKVNEVEKQYNNTETIIDDDTTDILYEQRFSDTNIIRLRFNKEVDLKFKSYMCDTELFHRQAYRLCDGSGQRYVISLGTFREMEIYIPKSIEEQKRIGELLSAIDDDIDNLKKLLELRKQQKKGLMQRLLTGEIRV